MDVREKLVELQSIITCPNAICNFCEHFKNKSACERHKKEVIADNMISHGVTVQEWISVDDRLPEDDLPKDTKKKMIRCLVYTNKGTIKPCVRQRWEVNGKLVPWQWNKDLFANPTHWMYYPLPPKGE